MREPGGDMCKSGLTEEQIHFVLELVDLMPNNPEITIPRDWVRTMGLQIKQFMAEDRAREAKPDFLCQALNEGDGVYRP